MTATDTPASIETIPAATAATPKTMATNSDDMKNPPFTTEDSCISRNHQPGGSSDGGAVLAGIHRRRPVHSSSPALSNTPVKAPDIATAVV